jgi:hypothetical protein
MSDTQVTTPAERNTRRGAAVIDLTAFRAARERKFAVREPEVNTSEGRRGARKNADELPYRNLIELEFLHLQRSDLEQRMELGQLELRILDDLAEVPNIVRKELRELLPGLEGCWQRNLLRKLEEQAQIAPQRASKRRRPARTPTRKRAPRTSP